MFFCCDICAVEFRNMVNEVKKRTGWKTVDEIRMTGNYRGRECTALYQGKKYGFKVRFDSKGGIDLFSERAKVELGRGTSRRDPATKEEDTGKSV
jgi:hypothetical protein